jgi:hypothetical protein
MATSFTVHPAGGQNRPSKGEPAETARAVRDYGKLPLSFEANAGQVNPAVKFLSRGLGYTLFLTGDEAVLALEKPKIEIRKAKFETGNSRLKAGNSGSGGAGLEPSTGDSARPALGPRPPAPSVFRMKLAGARGKAEPKGEEQLPGTANYFLSNDPSEWHTRVPTYAKVRYASIYPGIDLVYYGNPSALEFDFLVAPDADPGLVRLRFDGPSHLRLAANGDLVMTAVNGALVFRKPLVYQRVEGDRQPVAGAFTLLDKHTVGFRLGSYDRSKALVIDPALAFSTFLGGSGFSGDTGNAIAVDSAGNAYVTGSTCSTDFPVTPGAFQTTNAAAANSGCNAFVTKLNPSGTALVYSTYLGGSGTNMGGDNGRAIAMDAAGNAYVSGQTYSTDFPVTQGAFQTTNRAAANETSNAFVTKLNATGTALVYSTYLGGSGFQVENWGDAANAIAVDAAGDAYVAGQSYSPDFPVTQGAFQTTNNCAANECANAFITKLNPAGTALVYSTYLGGSGGNRVGYMGDVGTAITVDAQGQAYLTGQAGSSDFPVTSGVFQTANRAVANQGTNAFITELNTDGTGLVYSTYLGGSGGDEGNAIAVDTAGNAYVAGQTGSTDFPVTAGAFQTTNRGAGNAFVSKLNPAGAALVYSTYLGGSGGVINLTGTLLMRGGDVASGLAIDSSGNAYVTGSTASTNFPVTQGAYQTTNNDQPPCASSCIGGYNGFITELNSTGSALVYSTYWGGNGINPGELVGVAEFGYGDQAKALALDNSGNVYVTGSAVSYDFPVTSGAYQTTVNSRSGNAFVAKLSMSGTSTATTPTVTVTPASTTITSGQSLTVTVSVSGGSGNPTPTGTVTLASGTYASPATTLTGGSATFNLPAGSLVPQWDDLLARYLPDTASSSTYTSASGMITVHVIAPYISATPSSSTLTWAQAQSQALPVAIALTVPTGNPVPTGTVTLTTGSWSSAATALSGGSATISIPPGTLTTGFNVLNVSYSGDSNYAPISGSGPGLVTVGAVTVSVVPSSSSISSTQALPVTITVSAGSGSPTATGMVWLISGSYMSAVTPLAGGTATITIPAGTLPPGVDILEADYGEGNYAGASGQATVTVTGGNPGITITGTAVTVTAGATTGNVSFVTLTPSGGFTGSVTLTSAVTSSPTGAHDLPSMSFGGNSPLTISGSAVTIPLTISTTATVGCTQAYQTPGEFPWYIGGAAVLACLLFFGTVAMPRRRRAVLAALALLVALLAGLLACGGGDLPCTAIPGTTSGAYTITVTGSSGAITATGTVALTVQ